MSEKTLHNTVRQTLMNELGLTRDVVREEMKTIIEQTVARHVTLLMENGFIEKLITKAVADHYGYPNWRGAERTFHEHIHALVESAIKQAIQKAAAAFVTQHVQIRGDVILQETPRAEPRDEG